MKAKHLIVTALLYLYPAAWRGEYGPELANILLGRPLGARIAADVLRNALRQRAVGAEPSTVIGAAASVMIAVALAWNIAAPPSFGHGLAAVLQDSSKTWPTMAAAPLGSECYVLCLIACGYWTTLRHRGTAARSGVAAMKLCLIAATPIVLAAILMGVGVVHVLVLQPGETPTTLSPHGLTYTYFQPGPRALSPLAVLLIPLSKMPESWLWGVLGGWLARRFSTGYRRSP